MIWSSQNPSADGKETVDSLTHIRKLKAKNIAVYFEKENINTLGDGGEMLITILSSQAQEESREGMGKILTLGVWRQFERVVYVNHNKFLGYTKDGEGNLLIVPDEAGSWSAGSSDYIPGRKQH